MITDNNILHVLIVEDVLKKSLRVPHAGPKEGCCDVLPPLLVGHLEMPH